MNANFHEAIHKLLKYIEVNEHAGYDPYDTLNSWIPFLSVGKFAANVATQLQKRNPVNIRPIIGVKKGLNPKGMGLFLKSYVVMYEIYGNENYFRLAKSIFEWLCNNFSRGFSGKCWGYNFDWATPSHITPAFTPSVVVTGHVVDGIYSYYLLTGSPQARDVIISSARYVSEDIPISTFPEGISLAYTHLSKGACYNASLLAAEILAKADLVQSENRYATIVDGSINYVLSKQKKSGEWWYSYDPTRDSERKQIDFHQGFVLNSLNILNSSGAIRRADVDNAISKGLRYYRDIQFRNNGQSLWRIPREWPVDIHNQSQGIITFSNLAEFDIEYNSFANVIASWTIQQMQDKRGFFYYRKYRLYTNKISYMRWSQAWMLLALVTLAKNNHDC